MLHFKSISLYIYLFAITVLTFTVIQGYYPFFRESWLIYTLALITSLFVTPQFYTSKSFFLIVIYFLVVLFNALSGDEYFKNYIAAGTEVLRLLVPVVIFYYASHHKNGRDMAFYAIWILFFIITFETIASYLLDLRNPGIIRALFSEGITSGETYALYNIYFRLGLSNYFLPHAVPMLIPPLIMAIKVPSKSTFVKVICGIMLFFVFLLVWLSGATTALILAFFIFISAIMTRATVNILKQGYLFISFLILAPFIFSKGSILWILNILGESMKNNAFFYNKILIFQDSLTMENMQGDLGMRIDLYYESLEGFLKNPLIGTNDIIGNHSALLDRLSVLGIIGFIPLILFLILQIQSTIHFIDKKYQIFYIEGAFVGLLMLLTKDVDVWEMFFMLLAGLPMFFIILREKKQEV